MSGCKQEGTANLDVGQGRIMEEDFCNRSDLVSSSGSCICSYKT